ISINHEEKERSLCMRTTDLLEEYYTKAARHIQTPASTERSYTIQQELPKQKRGNLDTDPNCKRIRQTAKSRYQEEHTKRRD
ncbi:unnamed protein product, partial [Musa acuminata subsp. burmannicoides]